MKMNPGMFDVTRDEDEAEVEDQNDQDLLLTLQEDHVCDILYLGVGQIRMGWLGHNRVGFGRWQTFPLGVKWGWDCGPDSPNQLDWNEFVRFLTNDTDFRYGSTFTMY
jgi:hypothetical protein